VLKVLSEDEVEAVVEKIEGEIAEVEETKRATAQQRRVATQRTRKQAERIETAAESLLTIVEADTEGAQDLTQQVEDTVRESVSAASEAAERSSGQVVEIVSLSHRSVRDLVGPTSQALQAAARSTSALARGAGAIALEWSGMRQQRLLKSLDHMNELLLCRSVQDVLSVQSTFIRENLEQMVGNSQHLAQLTAQVTREATRSVTASAEQDS
jgi:hypothetical protein